MAHKLNEANSQGDKLLGNFTRQVEDAEAIRSAKAKRQQSSSSSSSATSATTTGTVFHKQISVGYGAGRSRRTQMLFSSDEDMEKLNSTVDRLEQVSRDIREFIRLFQLEAWARVDLTPTKSMRAPLQSINQVKK